MFEWLRFWVTSNHVRQQDGNFWDLKMTLELKLLLLNEIKLNLSVCSFVL